MKHNKAKLFLGCIGLLATMAWMTPPKENWISLFNGKDLSNWTVKIFHHEVGDNYGNTFRAEDGM
ncbi:MAG: hypothetical protein RLZZ172_2468, partial [Bacteroidota bacterium]